MPVFSNDDPIETYFPHSMQAWNATRLVTECDGEYTTRAWDEKAQAYDRTPHACKMQADGVCPIGCKWTGRLKVMLPHLVPIVGFHAFTLTTHGKKDIEQIVGALEFVHARGLPIDSIRWQMLRTPARSQYKDANGKVQTRDYYPVSLVMVGVNESLFGNPTQADAPRLADVNYRADDDEVPKGRPLIEMEFTNPALWTPQEEHSVGRMVMDYLIENFSDVPPQPTDIFTEFGWVTSWQQLSDKLKSQGVPNSVQGIGNAIAHKMGYKLIETSPPPAPRPPANVSIAQAVITVLADEHGQTDVQSSDILHMFEVESWDELSQKWTGERTARALATEYMRLFVMKTREF